MPVHMHAVKSTNVEAIGHHEGALHVRFKGGGTYVYDKVPADLFERARAADSVGSFIHQHVKGKFDSRKA